MWYYQSTFLLLTFLHIILRKQRLPHCSRSLKTEQASPPDCLCFVSNAAHIKCLAYTPTWDMLGPAPDLRFRGFLMPPPKPPRDSVKV